MHVVIINGSPRIKKNSNTGKIISAFTRGLGRTGATFEVFALSDRIDVVNLDSDISGRMLS